MKKVVRQTGGDGKTDNWGSEAGRDGGSKEGKEVVRKTRAGSETNQRQW